jgi:hypothetical protein
MGFTTKASNRYITIPSGQRVTIGEYVKVWKAVSAMPAHVHVNGWGQFSTSAGSIQTDMMDGLMARINRHIPGYGKGRKWSSEWFWEIKRSADLLNCPRQRVYWLPKDLQARFSHRLCRADD